MFKGVNPEAFEDAVKLYMRDNRFFPTPADVRACLDGVQRRREIERPVVPPERQIESRVMNADEVRKMMIEKGLKDADGNWIRRRKPIDPKYGFAEMDFANLDKGSEI